MLLFIQILAAINSVIHKEGGHVSGEVCLLLLKSLFVYGWMEGWREGGRQRGVYTPVHIYVILTVASF